MVKLPHDHFVLIEVHQVIVATILPCETALGRGDRDMISSYVTIEDSIATMWRTPTDYDISTICDEREYTNQRDRKLMFGFYHNIEQYEDGFMYSKLPYRICYVIYGQYLSDTYQPHP